MSSDNTIEQKQQQQQQELDQQSAVAVSSFFKIYERLLIEKKRALQICHV
jgi:hypothetical protein